MQMMEACKNLKCKIVYCQHKLEHEKNVWCISNCELKNNNPCAVKKEVEEKVGETKYKQLKAITGKQLAAAGACEEELEKFIYLFGFNVQADFKTILDQARFERGWIAFLLDHYFIEEAKPLPDENEVMAKMGDKFTIDGEEYILASTRQNALGLVNIREGTRWNDAMDCVELSLTRAQFRSRLDAEADHLEDILKTKRR